MKHILFLLISLLNYCILVAQPTYQIKHYSVNDGMSQGIVQTIIQDKKGFLWFGTWNGLNKFDGYTFKNYKTSYKDAYILNTNRISQIAETKYGDIWCQVYDGRVYMFDNQTEKFIDVLSSVAESMIMPTIFILSQKVFPGSHFKMNVSPSVLTINFANRGKELLYTVLLNKT